MLTGEFNYQGKKMFYRTKGSGPLLLLLHGFGEDGEVWKAQFDLFPGHRLVIPDLPGTGKSDMIEDMSMEGLAAAIKALIDGLPLPPSHGGRTAIHQPLLDPEANKNIAPPQSEVSATVTPPLEGPGEAVIIGHSMGGYITLAFAERYPGNLKAFGLFHSTAFADSEEKKETRRKGISFIRKHGAFEFLKTSIPNMFASAGKENREQLISEQLASMRNANGAALVSYYESMINRPDRTAVLKQSRVPVLFVFGKHDKAVPLEDGLKQCHLPQLSYIELLQYSAHMGMVEETERSNQLLMEFIKTL